MVIYNKRTLTGVFMKKVIFLSLIYILISSLLTGCIINADESSINSNPKYKAWKRTEGYMIKEEGSEERYFVAYSSSIQDKTHEATLYQHEYEKDPYTTLSVQEWDKDNIKYTTITTNRLTITNKPNEINGFIFYEEDNTLYIINTLYNYEKKQKRLKMHDDTYTRADYRFIIEVNEINDPIEILMDDTSGWD